MVFAVETGGRCGPEPTAFLRLLAQARRVAVRSALRALEWHHRRGSAEGPRQLTARAPPRRDGTPHAGAPSRDGAVLQMAERRKLFTYPELAQGGGGSVPLRARV